MYIKTFTQMVTVLETLEANLPTYAGQLLTTGSDQQFLIKSLGNALYIRDFTDLMDTGKKAYTAIKQRFYNGESGVIADGPVVAAYAPQNPLEGDTHGELMKLIGRIKDAVLYTHEIGVALGIEGETPASLNPDELKPTIQAFPAEQDYVYTAVIEKRSGYDMGVIEVQEIDAAAWTNVGRFSGKSQDITYAPGAGAGKPFQIRIRARLWKGAAHVGLWSDAVTITVNP